jgi:hypothetical protein
MSQLDDQFDLDIRLAPFVRPLPSLTEEMRDTGGWECYSVDASCGETCPCSTVETCNQQLEDCGYPFTYPGNYCEDQSDGCGGDGPTNSCGVCPDDATDFCPTNGCSPTNGC